MRYLESMICWNPNEPRLDYKPAPGRGEIAVVPWPDRNRRSSPYSYTTGACLMRVHELTLQERLIHLLAEFHMIVVCDGIDPQKAHRAFLEIDEYRKVISLACPGAEE